MGNKRTPEMRFEEFSGEWEECRLTDIVKLFGGNAFSSSESSSFGVPWLKIANVGTDGIDWRTSSYLPDGFWTSYKDYRLYKGDYVMALTRPILNHILKISIVDKKSLLNQRVAKLIFATNAEYGYQLLQRRSVVDKIENELAGTDPPNLGSGNLKRIDISITLNRDEQTQIGNFFKQLDETITLHQQELTTLQQTKQGFLQKMFPKEGGSVPEIRFSGFTEDWKLFKLEEVANYRRGSFPQPYGNREWYDEKNGMPFVQVVDVGENLKLVNNTKQKISKLAQPKSVFVEEGKVVITLQGSIGRVAITQYSSYVDRTLLIFENYKIPMNNYYFAYVIQQLFEREKHKAPGGTIKTITKKALSDFLIYLPNAEEQQTIGNFFKQLDETIALHQQELDALQETKKAFLQKMFV